jgi:probable HAF family extracellular repeat protein
LLVPFFKLTLCLGLLFDSDTLIFRLDERFIMKIALGSDVRYFILTVTFFAGLGYGSIASAQIIDAYTPYFVDIGSKTVTKLGSLTPGMNGVTYATGINDAGQVVGYSATAEGTFHAFITGANGMGMRDIGSLGGQSRALGINNIGQVTGIFQTSAHTFHAFITGADGVGMRDIGAFPSNVNMTLAINNIGQVAGSSEGFAFVTGTDGMGRRNIGPFPVTAINDGGQVVGSSFITGPDGKGLGDLGPFGGNYVDARDINKAGEVAVTATNAGGSLRAFITGPDGVGTRDLGTLGGDHATSWGINEAGQVVGWSSVEGEFILAFITGPHGMGMMNLNALVDLPAGTFLSEARGINNSGQILAIARVAAVPEPEIYALLLSGLVLIGLVARQKRRATQLFKRICNGTESGLPL